VTSIDANQKEADIVQLHDGRELCFSSYGANNGKPVLYQHGFPASRLEAEIVAAAAGRVGVRLIAVDRPGHGGSSYDPRASILSWADDMQVLIRTLNLQAPAVLAVSGGCPYALAMVFRLGESLGPVGIIGGLGPLCASGLLADMHRPARMLFGLCQRAPGLANQLLSTLVGPLMARNPELALRMVASNGCEADREVLACPEVRSVLLAALAEAFRSGASGPARGAILLAGSWGFPLSAVQKRVKLWYATEDATVPLPHGTYLQQQLPVAVLETFAEEGHFSLPIRHAERLLTDLVS